MKRMTLFLILFLSSVMVFSASEEDSKSFDITFQKKGQSKIGFADASVINGDSGSYNDSDLADIYEESWSEEDFVRFSLGDSANGKANASASVGIFWYLFSEGNSEESYTIDVFFTADGSESTASNIETGMLSSINTADGSIEYLNYDVSVDNVAVLNPSSSTGVILGSNIATVGNQRSDARRIRFEENNVSSSGELVSHVLGLSIDAPYGDASGEQEGIKSDAVYSGYIIMRLERV